MSIEPAILSALGGFMNNINWKTIDSDFLTVDEFNAKIVELQAKGLTRTYTDGKREITGINKLRGHYFLSDANIPGSAKNQVMLYALDPDNGFVKYCANFMPGEEVKEKRYGYYGYKFINEQFREHYGIRMETAYSGKQFKDLFYKIKKCVCSPINYITPKNQLHNVALGCCFKSDESSSYPAKLAKSLPTLHGAITVPGRAEPNEQYPFAYYTKSHHMKIYNELDTRDFNNDFYPSYNDEKSSWKHFDDISADEDETILCKACEYNMRPVIEKIYAGRKAHPEYKDYMNMCIGYFHTTQPTTGPICSHIAAVVLARCIRSMIDRATIIQNEGNSVLLINTDAVCWMGKQSSISVPQNKKELGAFVVEHEDCQMIICGVKKYQIYDNGILKTVCSGLKEHKNILKKFGDIINYKIEQSYYVIGEDGSLIKKFREI